MTKKKNLILIDDNFSMIKKSYKQQPKMSQAKITNRRFTTLFKIKNKADIDNVVDSLELDDINRIFQPSFKLYTGHIQTNRRWKGQKGKCDETEYDDMTYDDVVTVALIRKLYDEVIMLRDEKRRILEEIKPESLIARVGVETVEKVNKVNKGYDFLVDKIQRLEQKLTTMNRNHNEFKHRVEYQMGIGWENKPKKTSPVKKRVVIKKKTTPPQSDTESIINEPEVVSEPVKEVVSEPEVVAEPVKEAVSTSKVEKLQEEGQQMFQILKNLSRKNKEIILDSLDIAPISSHTVYTNKAWRGQASEKSIKEEESKLKGGFNELYKMGYYKECNFEKAYEKTIQQYVKDYNDWADCEEGEPSLQHFLKFTTYHLNINGDRLESEELERYQGLLEAIDYIIES